MKRKKTNKRFVKIRALSRALQATQVSLSRNPTPENQKRWTKAYKALDAETRKLPGGGWL